MTGDGVNDVLALKDANCGIAMASGSQAASQVAQIVLLNSQFSAMPAIVAEGRRVINNIQRAASLFLVKNIFSFALTLLLLFIDCCLSSCRSSARLPSASRRFSSRWSRITRAWRANSCATSFGGPCRAA